MNQLSDQLRDKLLLKYNLTLERLEDIVASVDRDLQRRRVLQRTAEAPVSPTSAQVAEVERSAEQHEEVREPIRSLR